MTEWFPDARVRCRRYVVVATGCRSDSLRQRWWGSILTIAVSAANAHSDHTPTRYRYPPFYDAHYRSLVATEHPFSRLSNTLILLEAARCIVPCFVMPPLHRQVDSALVSPPAILSRATLDYTSSIWFSP